MHMIIVGCGRVGSTLAKELSSEGHDVVIIDRDATAFRRVGENFTGKTITGIGFDRGVLTSAGITADSAVMQSPAAITPTFSLPALHANSLA